MAHNWLDIIILVLVSLSVVIGFVKGFIERVFTVAGIIVSVSATVIFHDLVAELLINYGIVERGVIAQIGGSFVTLFFVFLIVALVGLIVKRLVEEVGLEWADKIAGGLLGLVIGIAASYMVVTSLQTFLSADSPAIKNSVLIPYVRSGYSYIKQSIPKSTEKMYEETKRVLEEKGKVLKDQVSDSFKDIESKDKEKK